jgi:hypothetical protein
MSSELLSPEDVEYLNKAMKLADLFSRSAPDGLRKTVFNALFWEACHYIFGRKLKRERNYQPPAPTH